MIVITINNKCTSFRGENSHGDRRCRSYRRFIGNSFYHFCCACHLRPVFKVRDLPGSVAQRLQNEQALLDEKASKE